MTYTEALSKAYWLAFNSKCQEVTGEVEALQDEGFMEDEEKAENPNDPVSPTYEEVYRDELNRLSSPIF